MPKRKKKVSRISPALARIAERGMVVREEDIRTFIPGDADLLIAEAMLGGALTFAEIAESIDRSPALVTARLKDPVLCAWVSRAVHQQIHTRLGMLDAAMFRRALGGDVRAYEALMKRYGQAADIKLNVNVGAENFDLMSDSALDALLNRRLKETALDVETKSNASKNRPGSGQNSVDTDPETGTRNTTVSSGLPSTPDD
jgi:hypothetical protein